MDYSEKMLRREIEKIPAGTYYAEGWVDDDAKNRDIPIKVAVTIPVEGSDVTVDFTGSSPEVLTAFNVPFDGSTKVCAYFIIRTIFLDEATYDEFVPQNQGFFRPIRVVAPEIAERDYGVIVRANPWRVDAEATRALREDRQRGR